MEMRIYIVNSDSYDKGDILGAWFDLPVDVDDVMEQLELDDIDDGYAIQDYELPFEIEEDMSIWELNRICELSEKLDGTSAEQAIDELVGYFFHNFTDLVENFDDLYCYPNCENMSDVARCVLQEQGALEGMPEYLCDYIDYEAYGEYLEGNGCFLVTPHGVFEYVA